MVCYQQQVRDPADCVHDQVDKDQCAQAGAITYDTPMKLINEETCERDWYTLFQRFPVKPVTISG